MTRTSGESLLDTFRDCGVYPRSIIRASNAEVAVRCQIEGKANLVQGPPRGMRFGYTRIGCCSSTPTTPSGWNILEGGAFNFACTGAFLNTQDSYLTSFNRLPKVSR